MLSSVIHRPLNWDPLLWPHARPQPGKWFSFDHESQVGYISALDLLYTFWKLQWLGPSLWQKSSWIKPDPAILKNRCFLIVLYRGSPGLFFHPSRGRTTRAGLSLPRWPPPWRMSFLSSFACLCFLSWVYGTDSPSSAFPQSKEIRVGIFRLFTSDCFCSESSAV